MSSLYYWPEDPTASILLLVATSMIFLWAARDPMLKMLRNLGTGLESGLLAVAQWCKETAGGVRDRSNKALLAAAEVELNDKVEREIHKIDASFAEKVGQYSTIHRRLDDLLNELDTDFRNCGDSPPDVPGWAPAVEAVANISASGDSNVRKVLEGIQGSLKDAGKKALKSYRDETSKRHGLLNKMRPSWKEVRNLMKRMQETAAGALQITTKIDRYVDEYTAVIKDRDSNAHALTYSAFKPFIISLLVMGVALGGAFINFQLIALPMSELVPAGARVGGLPVSTVSALVLVLMEAAVGIFMMDMLGITDLFSKLNSLSPSQRKMILWMSTGSLFMLASVESSLAVLREQIVGADAVLKLALAGAASNVVAETATSSIPVIGQAVLGFVLPWTLAMVAIPLEMFLDSSRHVGAQALALLLHLVGHVMTIAAHLTKYLTTALPGIYDVYVALPLRLERVFKKTKSMGVGDPEVVS